MSKTQKPKPPLPPVDITCSQLERMLSSPHLRATSQQISLLKYVINQTLDTKTLVIQDYTVAAEVFGRAPDFDPRIDPVVSIQAGILQRALERYYLTAGKHDPIRIDIPPGTCVPVFENRLHTQTTDP